MSGIRSKQFYGLIWLLIGLLAFISSCSSGSDSAEARKLDVVEVQNGFGLLLPHQIRLSSANSETAPIVQITTEQDLLDNIADDNPVLPVAEWPTTAVLPNGASGNHFLTVRFTNDLNIDSILNGTAGAPTYGLKGTITFNQINLTNPASPVVTPVPVRAFIGGKTYASSGSVFALVDAVGLSASGQPTILDPVATGFPGTASTFAGAEKLVRADTLTLIADSDNDLSTVETFPTGVQLQLEVTSAVTAVNGKTVLRTAKVSSTVGADTIAPEVLVDAGQNPAQLMIAPGNNDTDVSPTTSISVEFTEPVQPLPVALGSFFQANRSPSVASAVAITSGSQENPEQITFPFTISPTNGVFDLTTWSLRPAIQLPAKTPAQVVGAVVLNFVRVRVNATTFGDLQTVAGTGIPGVTTNFVNTNTLGHTTDFQTGEGPGIVNAPVAPEALAVARNTPEGGVISIIDLNGFGFGTGDPTNNGDGILDFTDVSKARFHPDRGQQAGIVPANALVTGNTTLDGGSGGVFTLTKDTALSDKLYTAIGQVGDMHLGRTLDTVFNNAPISVGGACIGEGNPCAALGLMARLAGLTSNSINIGASPNPPRLVIDPTRNCLSPQILGIEPISIASTSGGVVPTPLTTLLVGGDAFGVIGGKPPTGLIVEPINPGAGGVPGQGNQGIPFAGPGVTQADASGCVPFGYRQQIGHFLYVIDKTNDQLVVLNSNRMTLIDTIKLPDPTSAAFSPNLNFIAITNFGTNTVSFVGTDPFGTGFHKVVAEIPVGGGPTDIAWQSEAEQLFVCNTTDNSISILDGQGFQEIQRLKNSLIQRPIGIVVTPRYGNLGFSDGLFFAYIANANGTVVVYESGPGPSGTFAIGFNDVITSVVGGPFPNMQGVRYSHAFVPACWILHQDPDGKPQISRAIQTSGPTGVLPINPNVQFTGINDRGKRFEITEIIAAAQLGERGVPSDIAGDDMSNQALAAPVVSTFSINLFQLQDSKSLLRPAGTSSSPVKNDNFYFIPNPTTGTIRVIEATTLQAFIPGGKDASGNPIPVGQQQFKGNIVITPGNEIMPGVTYVTDYFRQ